jgi:hypothetical protein
VSPQKPDQSWEPESPEVEIPCPHCGGPNDWNLFQTLNQCPFCGSVLFWPYPEGKADYLVAESMLRDEADLLDVLALYDAMREASRRRARVTQHRDTDPDITIDLGSGFTDTEIYEIKRRRLPLFRLVKSVCVYVPYQLVSSLLAFHVLGRLSGDQKVARSLFFQSDAILAAYLPEWNFRDRGLQLSRQRLKPFMAGKWTEPFLATGTPAKEMDRLIRQWTNDRKLLQAEIQPITFEGKALTSRRWWVYRPYYFVNAQTPEGTKWYLVDGQFQTIAGMPDALEISRVTSDSWEKLDLQEVRKFEIKIVPFRCPNCGWDIHLQKGEYQVCGNCSRILQVSEKGLSVEPYRIIGREDLAWWPKVHKGPVAWLPFWRVRTSILFEKKKFEDFGELLAALLPTYKIRQQFPYFHIPAYDCWTVARYDDWSFQFGASLTEARNQPEESVLHDFIGTEDSIIPLTVSKTLVGSLFPEIMLDFTSSAFQARLNTMLFNRLKEAAFSITEQHLIYAPAPILEWTGSNPRIQGPRSTIDWIPLKEGKWPPMLQRTVRRWRALHETEPNSASKSRTKWFSY